MPYSKAQVASMRSVIERKAADKRQQRPRDHTSHSAGSAFTNTPLMSFFAPEPPLIQSARKRKRVHEDDEDDETERHQGASSNETPADERPTKRLRAGPGDSVPSAFRYTTTDAGAQSPANPASERPRRCRSPSRERIMEELNLLHGPPNAIHEASFPPAAVLPNELIYEILTHLDPVDKACFSLTSKRNYALVRAATHSIPRQLCPHQYRRYDSCELNIRRPGPKERKSDYRALLRRLALFLPTQDMVYCLTRGGRQAGWKRELEIQDRAWKRRFFLDLWLARMDVVARLEGMEMANVIGESGVKLKVRGAVFTPLATEATEWDAVVKKGRQMAMGGRVLRPRLTG